MTEKINTDFNTFSNVMIENGVTIVNRKTIKSGFQIWDNLRIKDDISTIYNVTFSNNPFPRSGHNPTDVPITMVKTYASNGGRATVLAGITIGRDEKIGADAMVAESMTDGVIAVGYPARSVRFTGGEQR